MQARCILDGTVRPTILALRIRLLPTAYRTVNAVWNLSGNHAGSWSNLGDRNLRGFIGHKTLWWVNFDIPSVKQELVANIHAYYN